MIQVKRRTVTQRDRHMRQQITLYMPPLLLHHLKHQCLHHLQHKCLYHLLHHHQHQCLHHHLLHHLQHHHHHHLHHFVSRDMHSVGVQLLDVLLMGVLLEGVPLLAVEVHVVDMDVHVGVPETLLLLTQIHLPLVHLPLVSPHLPLSHLTPAHARRRVPVAPPMNPNSFVWTDGEDFVPKINNFDRSNSCLSDTVQQLDNDAKFVDYFTLFFDNALVNYIVTKINKYFVFTGGRENVYPMSPTQRWTDVTVNEFYVFLALTIIMPLSKKHRIIHYWRKDALTYLPVFEKYMKRDRYMLIHKYSHFANDNTVNQSDSMHCIRRIF